jgi:hypothetical protein
VYEMGTRLRRGGKEGKEEDERSTKSSLCGRFSNPFLRESVAR